MRKRFDRKGFTLAEVLIVVAILVVLMGVGFVALMSHMRSMKQLELDGQAKEIFVAAQNHLALAESQGYLGVAEKDADGNLTGDFGAREDGSTDIYYIVVNNAVPVNGKGNALLKQMLPQFAVDESARAGGSYIIRYQKTTAKVLDVFYVETSGRYGKTGGFTENDYKGAEGIVSVLTLRDTEASGETAAVSKKEDRRDKYNGGKTVLGWYGGAEVADLPAGTALTAPTVVIKNEETLEVTVTDHNRGINSGKNHLVLVFSYTDASNTVHELEVPLISKSESAYPLASVAGRITKSEAKTNGEDAEFVFVLDDVTDKTLHFGSAESNGLTSAHDFMAKGFVPGGNITVKAIAYSTETITNIAESAPQTTNSLFASRDGDTVEIAYFRHLLNLDANVSGFSYPTTTLTAKQIRNLEWTSATLGTNKSITPLTGSAVTAGIYRPVDTYYDTSKNYTLDYNGNDLWIKGLKVTGAVNAGMFGTFYGTGATVNSGIKNLELVNCNITGTGNAGALIGEAKASTTISGVLAHNAKEDDSTALKITGAIAGGLVGKLAAGTVQTSAAAVYVSASGSAGGLIGETAGTVTVRNSYASGHTEKARYTKLDATGTTTTVNVISSGGAAGGLIGKAASGLTVNYSYATASVAGATSVGGLIGDAGSGASVSNCYSVGLVSPNPVNSTSATVSPFIAAATGTVSGSGNRYISNIASGTGVTTVGNFETEPTLTALDKTERAGAVPYDSTLALNYEGKYVFPTIEQLVPSTILKVDEHGDPVLDDENNPVYEPNPAYLTKQGITDVHVGDWQLSTMKPLNYMLINGDTLDLVFQLEHKDTQTTQDLTFAVTGESSGYTRIFTLKLQRDDANKKWVVTEANMTAAGPDIHTSASIDVKDYFAGRAASATPAVTAITARFGAYKFDATAYPNLAKWYDKSVAQGGTGFEGKRIHKFKLEEGKLVPAADGTAETDIFYDLHISLDDITDANGHFVQLLASEAEFATKAGSTDKIYAKLIPGENITVRLAGGTVDWSELQTIEGIDHASMSKEKTQHEADVAKYAIPAEYHCGASVDNSLFAKPARTDYLTTLSNMATAEIKNIRHLQNLDFDTSGVNDTANTLISANGSNKRVTAAELMNSIDWATDGTYFSNIYPKAGGTPVANHHFNGIYNDYLLTFDGNNKTVSNMVMGATYGTAGSNAGFFRLVNHDLTVKYLHLANPSIEASAVSNTYGHAGSFIAQITSGNVILYTVLAEGKELTAAVKVTKDARAVGGLVGTKGGSGSLVISNSAASLYINALSGPAGGMLGEQTSGTVNIYESYVGGHTTGYTDTNDNYYGGYYYVLDNNDRGDDGGTDRWNIISLSGAAGGLIGQVSGGSTGIEKSFDTASVYGDDEKTGGIIGVFGGTFAAVANDSTVMDDNGTEEDTTDDVVAVAGVSGKTLDLVYTVAPVFNVKTLGFNESTLSVVETESTGKNGAVFGTLNTAVTGANVFYLAQIYKDAKFTLNQQNSNISKIGKTSVSASKVQLASYFASGDSAGIIGTANVSTQLEQLTTAYDQTLTAENKEFPFALWTTFENKRHFYGDWEPIDNSPSYTCKIKFVVEQPGSYVGTGENKRTRTVTLGEETISIQIPFKSVTTTLPFIPYIPSYRYGDNNAGDNTWIVYWGDQTAALNNASVAVTVLNNLKSSTTYREYGTTVYLRQADVEQAFSRATTDASGNKVLTLTMMARYTKEIDHYKLELLDSKPTETEFKQCRLWVIDASGETKPTLKSWSEEKEADNVTLKYRIPVRRVSGYKFRGWCDTATDQGVSNCVFLAAADGSVAYNTAYTGSYTGPVNRDMTLYAWYEKNTSRMLTINFKYKDDKGNITELSSIPPYVIYFDAEVGFNGKTVSLAFDENLNPQSVTFYINDVEQTTAQFVTLDTTEKNLVFSIPAMTAQELRPRDAATGEPVTAPDELTYDVVFTGSQSEKVAYVVRYELMDTDPLGKTYTLDSKQYYEYSDTGSYVVKKSELNSTTEEDNEPEITINEDEYADYYFVYDEDLVIERDNSLTGTGYKNGFESKYDVENKIGAYTVKYVIVVKYARREFTLNYKPRGGTNRDGSSITPEKVPFGQPIHDFTDKHTDDEGLLDADERIGAPIYTESYTFGFWSLDEGQTKLKTTELMPAHTVAVYAKRVGSPAEYTVAFWYENATDNKYTYVGHQTITKGYEGYGKNADDWVDPKDFEDQPFELDGKRDTEHFVYADNESKNQKERVLSDGSTVVNVYFRRKLYTLKFKEPHRYEDATGENNSNTVYYAKVNAPGAGDIDSAAAEVGTVEYVSGYFPIVNGVKWQYQDDGGNWKDYNEQFYRQASDDDPPPQFAVVNGELVKLTPTETSTYKWVKEFVYYQTTDSYSKNSNQYVLVDYGGSNGKKYEKLYWSNRFDMWYYYKEHTGNTNNSTTYYGYYNGGYIQLYRDRGRLYRSRSLTWEGWVYSDEYTGTVYTLEAFDPDWYNAPTRYAQRPGDVNNSSDVVENPSGSEPYSTVDERGVRIKLIQKPAGTTYTWGTSPRYKEVETPTAAGTGYYGFADGAMRPLRYVTTQTLEGLPGVVYDPTIHGKWKRNSNTITTSAPNASYTNYNSIRVIHLKWQNDVSQYVPQHPEKDNPTLTQKKAYKWYADQGYSYSLVAMDCMPDMNIIFTPHSRGREGYNGEQLWTNPTRPSNRDPRRGGYINYYEEVLPGEAYDVIRGEKKYKLYKQATHGFWYLTYDEEFHPIRGFTQGEPDPAIGVMIGADRTNNFYYTRNQYTLEYLYNGHTVTAESVYYQQSLASYELRQTDPRFATLFSELVPDGYVFKGWYEDYEGKKPFNFDEKKMPAGNMVVYAKWLPVDKTVKFYLREGETMGSGTSAIAYNASAATDGKYLAASYTVEHGASLANGPIPAGGIADSYGDFKAAYQVSKKDANGKDYTFRGWEYEGSDGKMHDYDPAMSVETNLELYAKLDPPEYPGKATLTINYYVYDATQDDHIKKDNDGNPVTVQASNADHQYDIGSVQTITVTTLTKANEQGVLEEYLPKKSIKKIRIKAEEGGYQNKLDFFYVKKEPWTYQIEYYIHYPYVTADSWVPGGESLTKEGLTIKVFTKTYSSYNTFDILTYELPDELAGLSGFSFDHFVYQGSEKDDPVIFIQKDATNSLVIQCYVIPDETRFDALIDDETVYNGVGQQYKVNGTANNQTLVAGMCPTEAMLAFDKDEDEQSTHGIKEVTARMVYVYYDWQNNPVDIASTTDVVELPKDAGVYGIRACAILTVKKLDNSTQQYLIWQSLDSNSRPTIHFYVDRRSVYLKSRDVTATSPNVARSTLQSDIYEDTAHSGEGIGFIDADKTKITYIFSADAFRQIEGTTTHGNIFDYIATDDSIAKNYNIFKEYGNLTVTKGS